MRLMGLGMSELMCQGAVLGRLKLIEENGFVVTGRGMSASDNINDQVTSLLREASTRGPGQGATPEFDILEMPLEGVAAYWLSVKKTLDSKKNAGTFLPKKSAILANHSSNFSWN